MPAPRDNNQGAQAGQVVRGINRGQHQSLTFVSDQKPPPLETHVKAKVRDKKKKKRVKKDIGHWADGRTVQRRAGV